MFGSDILDVILGMTFVFLLASVLCSAANELIASFLKLRAKDLERGIGELVGDPTNAGSFLQSVYSHGLINGLFKGEYLESRNAAGLKRLFGGYKLPSYVPAQNFALALIAIVENPPAGVTVPENVKSAIKALEKGAEDDFNRFRQGVEAWYNSAMDRVSGWYKRRTQRIIVTIGFVLAVVVNIDTIQIAQTLSTDSALRKSIVAAAQAYAAAPHPQGENADPTAALQKGYNNLKDLQLPVCVGCRWGAIPDQPDARSEWWKSFVRALVGYLLTAAAVSFGAPFWFDALNKLIVVRSTVKPREKSQEEKSKDAR